MRDPVKRKDPYPGTIGSRRDVLARRNGSILIVVTEASNNIVPAVVVVESLARVSIACRASVPEDIRRQPDVRERNGDLIIIVIANIASRRVVATHAGAAARRDDRIAVLVAEIVRVGDAVAAAGCSVEAAGDIRHGALVERAWVGRCVGGCDG